MSDSQALSVEDGSSDFQVPGSTDIQAETRDQSQDWSKRHPINIRLTIPFFVKKYYLTFVAGTERRDPKRRVAERKKHPFWTIRNIAFLAVVTFYVWFFWRMLVAITSVIGSQP